MQPQTLYQRPDLHPEQKQYSVGGLSTVGSPKNISQVPARIYSTTINQIQSSYTNNPEIIATKPISVQIRPSVQGISHMGQVLQTHTIQQPTNVGATLTLKAAEQHLPNLGHTSQNTCKPGQCCTAQGQNYRILSNKRVPPSRPNYHFFGSGSRNETALGMTGTQLGVVNQGSNSRPAQGSASNSPALVNQNINSQSHHSHSPITIQSNSSQANKLSANRVHFTYGSHQVYSTGLGQLPNAVSQLQVIAPSAHAPISTQHPIVVPTQLVSTVNQFNHPPPNPTSYQPPSPHMELHYNQNPAQYPTMYNPQLHQFVANNPGTHVITTSTTIVWEHRFVAIYSKFQIFVEKFENIIEEIYYIDDLFDNVSDEEAWNDLRVRYTDMIENFNSMREDIILALEQNKDAINSLSPEVVKEISEKQVTQAQKEREGEEAQEQEQENEQNDEEDEQQAEEGGQTGKSGSQNNHIWENRCLELMQQHQILTKENNELKVEIERINLQSHSQGQADRKQRISEPQGNNNNSNNNTKVLEMQKNLNLIHSQYQKLETNYNNLSAEYTRVVGQLQSLAQSHEDRSNPDMAEMEQQLEMAQAKINELYEQLQSKTQNIDQLEKQIQSYGQILQQNKMLMETVNKMNHDLDKYEREFKNKEKTVEDYEAEMQNLHHQINEYSKTLEQRQQQYNAHVNTSKTKNLEHDKSKEELEVLKQQNKGYLNMIEKHEQSIEQMALKTQKLVLEHEIALKQRDDQLKILQAYLQQERQSKNKITYSGSAPIPEVTSSFENITESSVFKERLQLEIDEVLSERNRKIRLLTQDLDELKYQIESIEKDKQKQIKQIKQYFVEEEDKYIKKIQEKENSIKLLHERTKSFENQLSNRNLEISRFRHQSPVNSFSGANQQSKKYFEGFEKKNYEIQQLRRTIEQKNINIKQLQQKIISLEQQIQGKMFEVNSLKRQANQLHSNRAEIDNLNNVIKKKNQQVNQLRLSTVEMDQLRMSVDSLQRQKIRLTQYLKQKARESQAKDGTIQSLERKINSISYEVVGSVSRKASLENSTPLLSNYQNLLKQRENQIKNYKYEIDMLETKIQIGEKTTRDLNSKVTNYQKSASVLKAQMQNKANRYETDIKALNKEIKSLKDKAQQSTNQIQSLQTKNHSLQRALDERNSLFDKEIGKGKQKISSVEQLYTGLLIDQELMKSQSDRLNKQNKELNEKIRTLQSRVEEKNRAINDIKGTFNKKQREDTKLFEQKIKKLDSQLKASTMKLKKMEQEIANLNKKIELTQTEKKSYRDRLIKQNSTPKQEFIDFKSQYEISNDDLQQMERFKLKDPEANDIFERKVIYELKKQNDFLKRQLSGLGPASLSAVAISNHYESQNRLSYQRDFYTERGRENQSKNEQYNNEIIGFYKNKNKELQTRIDELLKVNNQFKTKIAALSSNSSNQLSIQFYKDQVTKLETQNGSLQAKIKKMLNDHQSVRDEVDGHEHENESLRSKVNQQNLKINQLRLTIQKHQTTITQLENTKQICYAEIQRLKQTIQKIRSEKQELNRKDNQFNQSNRKNRSLEEQVAKLTNKVSLQAAEIQRLNESLRSKNASADSKLNESSEQLKRLKKRILELEKQLELLKLQHQSFDRSSGENTYKIQKLRSYLIEFESLLGELPLSDRRSQQISQQMRHQIHEGFTIISMIQI